MTTAFIELFNSLINIYILILIAMIIVSWLQAFNIINTRNAFMYQLVRTLHILTEPVLAPIRRILPSIGGLDLSPIVVFLGLRFLQTAVNKWYQTGNPL